MEFGGDVATDYVLNTDFSRFDFAGFEQASHRSPLLFGHCFVLLLDHAEAGYRELELNFEFCLGVLVRMGVGDGDRETYYDR